MLKVITITLNSSIDEYVETVGVADDGVGEIGRRHEVAAGKGVNVSRELLRLGSNSLAYCGTGTNSDDRFRALILQSGIQAKFIVFEGQVRRNITFVDLSGQISSIHLKGVGYQAVGKTWLNDIIRCLHKDLAPNDIVSINGSLPKGADVSAWQAIGECVVHQHARLWADISGHPLTYLLDRGPAPTFLKINFAESEFIDKAVGNKPLTLTDTISNDTTCICKRLIHLDRLGVFLPIITHGGMGAYFIFEGAIWRAVAPRQKDIMRVGAGDAMFAFILWRRVNSDSIRIKDIVDSVTYAASYVANRGQLPLDWGGPTELVRVGPVPHK